MRVSLAYSRPRAQPRRPVRHRGLHGARVCRINFALTWLARRGKSHANFLLTIPEGHVVKPEWGVKRTCHSCGAKFYDLKRDPIVCPKCGTTFDFETALKSRKVRTTADAKPVPAKAKAKVRPVKDEDTDALADIEDIEDIEDVEDVDDDVLAEEEDADDTLEDVVATGPKRVASDEEDDDEDIDLDLDEDEDEALLIDEDEDDSLEEADEDSDEDEDEEPRGR